MLFFQKKSRFASQIENTTKPLIFNEFRRNWYTRIYSELIDSFAGV